MSRAATVERHMTLDAFLSFLETRPNGERWELDDGRPVMNPQPTLRHDWIQSNIIQILRSHWNRDRSSWRPSGPSQVPVPGKNRTVAPDVIVAPTPERDDVSVTPLPIVVFEVLSKSDTKVRQTRKLTDYEAIVSIQHYVVIRQDFREVSAYRRVADGSFTRDDLRGTIELTAIGVSLTLDAIYDATPLGR